MNQMDKKDMSRRAALRAAGTLTASAAVGAWVEPSQALAAEPGSGNHQMSGQGLEALWERHLASEFEQKSARAAVETMVEHPSVNHVPVMTGGVGREQLEHFYGTYFIPQMPEDTEIIPISRTIGEDRIVDEFVFKFTHSKQMDWFLPGIAPTHKPVEITKVVVVEFEDGKIKSERIHWDQASVLVQVGLLDANTLPVAGVATARKAVNPELPSNELMKRTIKDEAL